MTFDQRIIYVYYNSILFCLSKSHFYIYTTCKMYRVLDYFWKGRTQFEVFMIIFFKADTKNSDLHDMF